MFKYLSTDVEHDFGINSSPASLCGFSEKLRSPNSLPDQTPSQKEFPRQSLNEI